MFGLSEVQKKTLKHYAFVVAGSFAVGSGDVVLQSLKAYLDHSTVDWKQAFLAAGAAGAAATYLAIKSAILLPPPAENVS